MFGKNIIALTLAVLALSEQVAAVPHGNRYSAPNHAHALTRSEARRHPQLERLRNRHAEVEVVTVYAPTATVYVRPNGQIISPEEVSTTVIVTLTRTRTSLATRTCGRSKHTHLKSKTLTSSKLADCTKALPTLVSSGAAVSSTPVKVPVVSSTFIQVPVVSSTPIEMPVVSSTPIKVPVVSSTPIKVPVVSSTPIKVPVVSSTAAPVPTASSVPGTPYVAGTYPATSGTKPGIVYSPYRADNSCKTREEVKAEIAMIKDFSPIRLYGVDCNQIENVIAAVKPYGSQVFAGIYNVEKAAAELQTLIKAVGNDWASVHTVAIGNEVVNFKKMSTDAYVKVINDSRATLRDSVNGPGWQGPVVGPDTFVAILSNPAICEASDYVAANCHPYFDTNVPADKAGEFLNNMKIELAKKCGNKAIVIAGKSIFILEV